MHVIILRRRFTIISKNCFFSAFNHIDKYIQTKGLRAECTSSVLHNLPVNCLLSHMGKWFWITDLSGWTEENSPTTNNLSFYCPVREQTTELSHLILKISMKILHTAPTACLCVARWIDTLLACKIFPLMAKSFPMAS